MTTFSVRRLSEFVSWAGLQQKYGLATKRPWVTTVAVGRATDNRAVSFKAELFRIEPTGWIGNEVMRGGLLTLWENGCADAEYFDFTSDSTEAPQYVQHWDDVEADQFDALFAPFLAKLKD